MYAYETALISLLYAGIPFQAIGEFVLCRVSYYCMLQLRATVILW